MPQLLLGERNVWLYSLLQLGWAGRCIDANNWALGEVVVGIGDRSRIDMLLSEFCSFLRNETSGKDLLACPMNLSDCGVTGQNRMVLVHGGDNMHSGC
jgi:hypothetical protein